MSNGYGERLAEALPDRQRVQEEKARLESLGVKYIFSCWIDMLGIPKTKPVPISDFELLCMGKGPQFAVHSISFVPELGPADSDQIPPSVTPNNRCSSRYESHNSFQPDQSHQ